jgi:hypothetical protein
MSYSAVLSTYTVARQGAQPTDLPVEQRSADGDLERLPGLVAELIGIGVTVIVRCS